MGFLKSEAKRILSDKAIGIQNGQQMLKKSGNFEQGLEGLTGVCQANKGFGVQEREDRGKQAIPSIGNCMNHGMLM